MVSVQAYADAGSEPSWASLPVASKEIVSPTAHASDADGLVMSTVGGAFATETVCVAVPAAPSGSVTRRPTVTFMTPV
jgi:hypothetical protein